LGRNGVSRSDRGMGSQARLAAFRQIAAELDGIDATVYREYGRDRLEPVIGMGPRRARLAFFGRDPGREEVRWQIPFIGAGGQKVRAALYRVCHGREMPDFEASRDIGRLAFWANTAPYKPIGNKAWPQRVKRAFFPLMADLLIHEWLGADVITLGREAFLWFGLGLDRAGRQALDAFWRREDRFESSVETRLTAPDGAGRVLRLHPLPHPSPLNATWFKRFPALLEARLRALDFSLNHWQAPLEA